MLKSICKIFHQESELYKSLKYSSLTKDNFIFRQEDLDFFIQFMIEEENIKDFFEYYSQNDMLTYTIKMKLLLIVHQVIYLSDEFSKVFCNIKFDWFSRVKNTNRNNERWMLENIQLPLISYLQKLAVNMKEIKSYRIHIFRKSINKENLIQDSFRLVNIINLSLSFVPNFLTALTNYPYDFLIKKVVFNLYSETLAFYRKLINFISILISESCGLQKLEKLELVREAQTINQKLIYFYSFHQKFDSAKILQPPQILKLSLENNSETQRSIGDYKFISDDKQYCQTERKESKESLPKRQIFSVKNKRLRNTTKQNSLMGQLGSPIQEVYEEQSNDDFRKQASVLQCIN